MKYLTGLISFVVVLTLLLVVLNPQMHKEIKFVNIEFNVEHEQHVETPKQIQVSSQKQATSSQKVNVTPQKVATKVQNVKTTPVKTTPKSNNVKVKQTPVKKVAKAVKPVQKTVKKEQKTVVPKQNTKTPQKQVKQTKVVKPTLKPTSQKVATSAPKPTQKEQKTIVQPQTLTTQEETIAWNQWNANVRNKILSDLARLRDNNTITLSDGCTYRYSFVVSKDEKISNVTVTSTISNTNTQAVVNALRNQIYSYNGRSFLAFPTGSQKNIYTVSSSIVISASVKQDSSAKASDFSEYEKIKH